VLSAWRQARVMASLAEALVQRAAFEAQQGSGHAGSGQQQRQQAQQQRSNQQRLRATALWGRAAVLDPSDCG